MRVLLDTHVWLWWLADGPALGPAGRELVADPANLVHVSAASVWEAGIKASLGRLELDVEIDLASHVESEGFTELPITAAHASAASRLPHHHDDPFDRMLVAQARAERLVLMTSDEVLLGAYEVDAVEP